MVKGTIEFADFTKDEQSVVDRIVGRATKVMSRHGYPLDRMSLEMDIAATHAKCPLRLQELLNADDFNFAHDVFGIMGHIDRSTGLLGDCFVPRFAASPQTDCL